MHGYSLAFHNHQIPSYSGTILNAPKDTQSPMMAPSRAREEGWDTPDTHTHTGYCISASSYVFPVYIWLSLSRELKDIIGSNVLMSCFI